MVTVCTPSQNIQCEIDFRVCLNKAHVARDMYLLCVIHACIVHRKGGFVKVWRPFRGFSANIAQITGVVPELYACGILLPVPVDTYV